MAVSEIRLFALEASRPFGEKVARALTVPLAAHEERSFEDGEHKARPLENVRGRDVYVIQSLYGDDQQSVNDKLCRLLFFIGALRDASAAGVTAVVPYLCYARKDRKTKARDPVTTRYVAALFEAVGTDRILTLGVHNLAAFQNAFRCRTDHLEAQQLFVAFFAQHLNDEPVAVISPDVGGMKRAEAFRRALGAALGRPVSGGFMEKRRSAGVVSGDMLFADVADRYVVIIDDLISTGTTMLRAAKAAKEKGATKIYAAATHGLFVQGAERIVSDPTFEKILVTDSVPPFRLRQDIVGERLVVLDTTELVGDAIHRIQTQGSIVDLLGTEG